MDGNSPEKSSADPDLHGSPIRRRRLLPRITASPVTISVCGKNILPEIQEAAKFNL